MKKYQSKMRFLLDVLLAVGATVFLLGSMVTDPGNVMCGLGGDSGKNYFAFLYHAVYEHGFWFDGMNYPYGDHIIYPDGQPALSTFLQLFQPIDPHKALAVMNLLLSFSYVAGIVFTYKILVRFNVKPFIAIPFSCLAIYMDPQIFRVTVHFGLAYICTIPMLFYWTIKYDDTKNWKWLIYIFILGVIISLMHPYMGAIVMVWLGLYTAGNLLFAKSKLRDRLLSMAPTVVLAASIFLFIKIFLILTDPLKDRPILPDSTPEYLTHVNEIFTSSFSPIWTHICAKTGYIITPHSGEGYTYLGVVAMAVLSISLAKYARDKIRKSSGKLLQNNQWSPKWLLIAFGSLLIAICVPFCWNFSWYLKYLPFFKQFRSLGRFSWIFYYVVIIYSIIVINNIYEWMRTKKPALGYVFILLAILVWSYDVSNYVIYTREIIAGGKNGSDLFFQKNEIKWHDYLASKNAKAADFQAILVSPAFFSGSEKVWVGEDAGIPLSVGIIASMELHLPLIDYLMTRSSWSIAEKQVKLVAGRYSDKPMLRDLKSNKPFLLIHPVSCAWYPDEQYLLQSCNFIGNHYGSDIYACYPERIVANDKKNADSIKSVLPYMNCQDTCLVDKGYWYVNHFDSLTSGDVFFGSGAARHIDEAYSHLFTLPLRPRYDNQTYELSCWFLLYKKNFLSPMIIVQPLDSAGNAIDGFNVHTKTSVDNSGLWFRDSRFFNVSSKCRALKCTLFNVFQQSYESMDEFMLRPADAVIVSKAKDGRVMVNNHLLDGTGK